MHSKWPFLVYWKFPVVSYDLNTISLNDKDIESFLLKRSEKRISETVSTISKNLKFHFKKIYIVSLHVCRNIIKDDLKKNYTEVTVNSILQASGVILA